jgi:hypothetical protein
VPGAYAEQQADLARWREERAAQIAAGEPAVTVITLPEEDPKTKAKRLAKEAKEEARWRAKYYRQQEKEANRLDHSAYRAGSKAAETVNLDGQLKGGK